MLLQTGRLKVAGKLKLGPVLSQEMLNFRVLIDPMTAHDSYSAWREENHDDLVSIGGAGCLVGREWAERGAYYESRGDEEKVEVEEENGLKNLTDKRPELCRLL